MKNNPFIELLKLSEELEREAKKQESYELEIEFSGMVFRLDMENLEEFMFKIQEIGTKLEGGI